MAHPLDSVVFINLPETHRLSVEHPAFEASIPLPVQLASRESEFDSSTLTLEMILAGILTVLAYDKENAHLAYYRTLLLSAKSDIRTELTEAAILKVRNGDFELAEEIFLALHGLDPEDSLPVLNLALLLDERADNLRRSGLEEDADACDAEAFRYYKIAMTAEPPLSDAFFNAGFFYIKQQNYRKAREVLETYLSIETRDTSIVHQRKDKARQIIDGIGSRDLEDDLFKQAFDEINLGHEESALEKIRLFLEHHPDVWNGWFLLGWALRRLGRWEDAKAAFLQTLELGKKEGSGIESGYTDICNELSICLMETGDLAGSRKWLISALETESENTKIIANLGMVALKEGKKAEAAGFFRTVLEFDGRDQLALDMLKQLTAEGF